MENAGEDEQELQVPAGISLEDLIRLAELMQPAQVAYAGEETSAEQAPRDDQRVLLLAEYLLSKVSLTAVLQFRRKLQSVHVHGQRSCVTRSITRAVKDLYHVCGLKCMHRRDVVPMTQDLKGPGVQYPSETTWPLKDTSPVQAPTKAEAEVMLLNAKASESAQKGFAALPAAALPSQAANSQAKAKAPAPPPPPPPPKKKAAAPTPPPPPPKKAKVLRPVDQTRSASVVFYFLR